MGRSSQHWSMKMTKYEKVGSMKKRQRCGLRSMDLIGLVGVLCLVTRHWYKVYSLVTVGTFGGKVEQEPASNETTLRSDFYLRSLLERLSAYLSKTVSHPSKMSLPALISFYPHLLIRQSNQNFSPTHPSQNTLSTFPRPLIGRSF